MAILKLEENIPIPQLNPELERQQQAVEPTVPQVEATEAGIGALLSPDNFVASNVDSLADEPVVTGFLESLGVEPAEMLAVLTEAAERWAALDSEEHIATRTDEQIANGQIFDGITPAIMVSIVASGVDSFMEEQARQDQIEAQVTEKLGLTDEQMEKLGVLGYSEEDILAMGQGAVAILEQAEKEEEPSGEANLA